MDIEKTVEPYHREKHGQPSKAGNGSQRNCSPEQQHNTDSLFFESHIHFSGTGDQGKDKYPETMFLFFHKLFASVYNFIRKIIQIITDILRIFTELGTYLPGKLAQIETNVKG